jgi:hypothetical protein
MTMTKKLDPTAEALQRLEEHLELPYVSGELQAWSETLCQLLSKAGEQVRTGIATEHGRAYETIVKSRSNLTQQVDKLRSEEPEILAALASVEQLADRFCSSIDETVLAGQQFQPKREQLISDGLALILRVRRQRAAIDTWLGESLQRDNGVGD